MVDNHVDCLNIQDVRIVVPGKSAIAFIYVVRRADALTSPTFISRNTSALGRQLTVGKSRWLRGSATNETRVSFGLKFKFECWERNPLYRTVLRYLR